MITDEERRRVAKRMYDAADGTVWKGNSFCAMLARMTRAKKATRRDVMHRLADLIDRGECENAYDESEYGACDNGFECSVCGCRVEDEEHYHVSGTWNFCPQCGKRVRPKNE